MDFVNHCRLLHSMQKKLSWKNSSRFVFEEGHPESGPTGSESSLEGAQKLSGAFGELAKFFDGIAHFTPAQLAEMQKEFDGVNASNKDAVYQSITAKLDLQLRGKVDDGLLEKIHEGLKQSIDLHVEGGERVRERPNNTEVDLTTLQKQVEETFDSKGETKDYIDTFKDAKNIGDIASILVGGKLAQGTDQDNPKDSAFNFEMWPEIAREQPDLLLYLLTRTGLPLPHGKGRNKFLNGLDPAHTGTGKAEPESVKVLQEMVTLLTANIAHNAGSEHDLELAAKKNPLIGGPLSDIGKTLKKNYERAGGMEKAAMIGAAGFMIWYLWGYRDDIVPGFKTTKWSDVVKFTAGALAVNYLWGKGSKSGKTPLQHLDIMPDLDELQKKDSPIRAFGENHGLKDNPEKYSTLKTIRHQPIKVIYKAYQEAKMKADEPKSIPAQALGVREKEAFDGELAFDIMDELVSDTAINAGGKAEDLQSKLAEANNEPYAKKSYRAIAEEYTRTDKMFKEFERKYINKEAVLSGIELSVQQVIEKEYPPKDAQRIIESGQTRRILPGSTAEVQRRWDHVKGQGKLSYQKHLERNVDAGVRLLQAGGGKLVEWKDTVVNEYLEPWTNSAIGLFRRHVSIPLSERVNKVRSGFQEDEIKPILPSEFDVHVTSPGVATIMGYPGIKFNVHTRRDSKKVINMDGKADIVFDKGLTDPTNKAIYDKISDELKVKVKGLIAADVASKNVPQFANPKIEYDTGVNKWFIRNVSYAGHPGLGLKNDTLDVQVTIDPDQKTVHYLSTGKELKELNKLDEEITKAAIQDVILNDPHRAGSNYLKGLDVTVTTIGPNVSRVGSMVEGTIGGLKFKAIPHDLTKKLGVGGLDFVGTHGTAIPGSSEKKGGYNNIIIDAAHGGGEFSKNLGEKINKSNYVSDAFDALESQVDNMDDGIISHLDAAAFTPSGAPAKFWIISTSGKGYINGKVLKKLWKETLQFKRDEMLSKLDLDFQASGTTLDDLDPLYQRDIEKPVMHLQELSRYITSKPREDQADFYERFLSGQMNSTVPTDPPGLEYVNYSNPDYKTLFVEYKKMLQSFDFEGVDSTDIPFNDAPFEAYRQLMQVWSYNTMVFQDAPVISPGKQTDIKVLVTEAVRTKLNVLAKDGKSIKKKDLPKTAAEVDAWLPNKVTP